MPYLGKAILDHLERWTGITETPYGAFSLDYRMMVVRECVVDRTIETLERNLFDVDAKYADAVSLDEVERYLEGLSGAAPA